jgi:hypothetical protein
MTFKSAVANMKKLKMMRGKELPFHPLAEEIRSMHMSIGLQKFSPFYERFNELIGRMVTHGFIVYWNNYMYGKDPPKKIDEPEAQVLSLKHIGIGFIIILVLLALSLVVFALERIVHKIQNKQKPKRHQLSIELMIQT